MNGSRLFILLLVLLAVLFAVGLGVGVHKGDADDGAAEKKPWVKSLGSLTAPFAPKVKLPADHWTLAGPKDEQMVRADPDPKANGDKPTYRTAAFRLAEGGPVTIVFEPADGSDKSQLVLPRDGTDLDADERKHGSLVVGAAGGRFVFQPAGKARVELEQ